MAVDIEKLFRAAIFLALIVVGSVVGGVALIGYFALQALGFFP